MVIDKDIKKEKIRLVALFIFILLLILTCFILFFIPSHSTKAASPSQPFIPDFTVTLPEFDLNTSDGYISSGYNSILEVFVPSNSYVKYVGPDNDWIWFYLCPSSQIDDIGAGYTLNFNSFGSVSASESYFYFDSDTYLVGLYPYLEERLDFFIGTPPLPSPTPEPSPEVSPSPSPVPDVPDVPSSVPNTYLLIIIFLLGVVAVCGLFRK